jgi:hypothetical protein
MVLREGQFELEEESIQNGWRWFLVSTHNGNISRCRPSSHLRCFITGGVVNNKYSE